MAKGIDGRVDGFFSRFDGIFDRLFGVGEYEQPFTYGPSPWISEPAVKSNGSAVESKPSEELFGGYSTPEFKSKPKQGRLTKLLTKTISAYLESAYAAKAAEDFRKYSILTSLYNVNTNEMTPSYIAMLPVYNELARSYSSFEPQTTKTPKRARSKPRKPSEPRNPIGLRTRDKLEY
jgi:hypothetical protein